MPPWLQWHELHGQPYRGEFGFTIIQGNNNYIHRAQRKADRDEIMVCECDGKERGEAGRAERGERGPLPSKWLIQNAPLPLTEDVVPSGYLLFVSCVDSPATASLQPPVIFLQYLPVVHRSCSPPPPKYLSVFHRFPPSLIPRPPKCLPVVGPEDEACGHNCLNVMMQIECNKRACPCTKVCQNQRFQRDMRPRLEVYHTKMKGRGLRVLEDLEEVRAQPCLPACQGGGGRVEEGWRRWKNV